MLWIEVAAGATPIIYRAKKRRYLVAPKYLLKAYSFRCRAEALRVLTRYPDRYEFAKYIIVALQDVLHIPEVYHVERKKRRRQINQFINSTPMERILDDERDNQQSDFDR